MRLIKNTLKPKMESDISPLTGNMREYIENIEGFIQILLEDKDFNHNKDVTLEGLVNELLDDDSYFVKKWHIDSVFQLSITTGNFLPMLQLSVVEFEETETY